MGKTIKELADLLGVSKTAIRGYMTEEIRAKYTAKDSKGVITIDSAGCKLIAGLMERSDKLAEETENQFAESGENSGNVTIPRSVLEALEEQLRQKDKQIADLTETIKVQAQSINADRHNELAGTLQRQLLADADAETAADIDAGAKPQKKWKWLPWQR